MSSEQTGQSGGVGGGVDFGALADAAKGGDLAARSQFWEAFFTLPQWLFLARTQGSELSPFCLMHENKPMLAVFTDGTSAVKIAQERQMDMEKDGGNGGKVPVVALDLTRAVEFVYACGGQGISGIWVNPGGGGAMLPISAISGMLGSYRPELAYMDLEVGLRERFVYRKMLLTEAEGGSVPAMDAARKIFGQKLWWVIPSDQRGLGGEPLPFPIAMNGVMHAHVCTSDAAAKAFVEEVHKHGAKGVPAMVPIDSMRAIEMFGRMRSNDGQPVRFVQFDPLGHGAWAGGLVVMPADELLVLRSMAVEGLA